LNGLNEQNLIQMTLKTKDKALGEEKEE